jgi:hypothetical protein
MLPGLNRLDILFSIHRRDSRYTEGLQALMLEHLTVVSVDLDTPWLEVLSRLRDLVLGGCECCYEFGFGRAVEEVADVTGAHAA